MNIYTKESKEVKKYFEKIFLFLENEEKKNIQYDFDIVRQLFISLQSFHKKDPTRILQINTTPIIEIAKILLEEMHVGTFPVLIHCIYFYAIKYSLISKKNIQILYSLDIYNMSKKLEKTQNITSQIIEYNKDTQKNIITTADNLNVLLVHIAYILYDTRKKEKPKNTMQKAKFIYGPIAYRLGLEDIKTEWEDQWLTLTNTRTYRAVKQKLQKIKPKGLKELKKISHHLQQKLYKKYKIQKIEYRVKSPTSIWAKMQAKETQFHELYDIFALRIIFHTEKNNEHKMAWTIYHEIEKIYLTEKKHVKNFIENPKLNGYASLHAYIPCTIIKMDFEVQIRSFRMHNIAEKGTAAHWQYKSNHLSIDKKYDTWMSSARNSLTKSIFNPFAIHSLSH